MNRIKLLLLAGGLAACTGCGGAYRAETVLHADGGIDRAVYQPAADTPAAAQDEKLWKQVVFAVKPDDMDKKGWPDALTMLPAHAKDEQHPYFAAWNHFASVKEVPDAVRFKAPENAGLPDGALTHELTQTDLGFVEQYDWCETLNDVVSLPEMHKAREELADLLIQFGEEVFTEAVGKDYDTSDLVKWLKTDGKDWLNELTDLVFEEAAAHKGREAEKPLQAAILASCERHGLKLSKEGKPFDNPDNQKAFRDFALALVGEKVKKGGKPVGPDEAQKWLDELNSKDGGRFQPAAEKIIAQKYGGDKAFKDRATKLSARIIGLYLIAPPWDFHYAMTFPGPVVETNGELVGDGAKVLWHFLASDAYPLGYSMKARSLLVPEDARKLLGRAKPLSDRDALATYADLVRDDEPLVKVVRQCRADMSLDPLYEYLAGQKKINPGTAGRVEKVLKLLKAP